MESSKVESRFESIFNHVNEGILIADSSGSIEVVNPRVNQMFGYELDELIGQQVEMLIPQKHREHHVSHRAGYMKDPQRRPMGKNLILRGVRKNGTEFPVEISLSYYYSNEELFVIAFLIDITDRFEQQEEIKKINDELRLLNENLEKKVNERTLVLKEALTELVNSRDELAASLEKEKELNEMKSRFISMASHEFRTPLSTVLSSVSLISKYRTTEDQEKRDKHISRIKTSVKSLTEILNDFLSIGKLEEGKAFANPVEFDVYVALEELVAEMQSISRAGQTIVLSHAGDRLVFLDKQMLRNVVINLLANAIKFSAENKIIEVKSNLEGNQLNLEIIDQGIGVPEDEQVYLFDRFFRARNVLNIEGTGLGLHIVKKYLELMNGTIRFKSVTGVGTTFYLQFILKKND